MLSEVSTVAGTDQFTVLFKKLAKLELLFLSEWRLDKLELMDMYLLFAFLERVIPELSLLITADSPVSDWVTSVSEPLLSNRLTELLCDNVRELKFKEPPVVKH